MTELFIRSRADPGAGLTVSSAGVQALVGQPMDAGSAAAMVQLAPMVKEYATLVRPCH